jgi:Kef-type K+ transport system membrane component KefB
VDLLNLEAPAGTAWELFIAAAVIVIGPLIVERFRTPGMIGLLLGGLVIGPNVLGVCPAKVAWCTSSATSGCSISCSWPGSSST